MISDNFVCRVSGNSNKDFDLEKSMGGGQELYGIAFQYHMYGAAIGTARLETISSAVGASWDQLWTKSGDQGNRWNQATVYASSNQTTLRFRYTSQNSHTGDFALDDIRLGDCLTVGCKGSSRRANERNDCFCDRATGKCLTVPNADGTSCDDGNAETIDDICYFGFCKGCEVASNSSCEFVNGTRTFDNQTMQCPPLITKPDGASCDDDDAETTNDVGWKCAAGECKGSNATATTQAELESAIALNGVSDIELLTDISLSSTITLSAKASDHKGRGLL